MPNENANVLKAFSYAWQRYRDTAELMLRNLYASTAPAASLEKIGQARLVPRFPQETETEKYRDRVIDAYEENVGRGGYPEIIRVVEGYGFNFASFTSGFSGGDPLDSFNLLIPTISALKYDGTYQYDGSIKYNAVGENEILIEYKRATGNPIADATLTQINTALLRIVRASVQNVRQETIFV